MESKFDEVKRIIWEAFRFEHTAMEIIIIHSILQLQINAYIVKIIVMVFKQNWNDNVRKGRLVTHRTHIANSERISPKYINKYMNNFVHFPLHKCKYIRRQLTFEGSPIQTDY